MPLFESLKIGLALHFPFKGNIFVYTPLFSGIQQIAKYNRPHKRQGSLSLAVGYGWLLQSLSKVSYRRVRQGRNADDKSTSFFEEDN